MADRWSAPSGALGVHRFRVWPAGTDSYNHAELTTNFDTLDAIIGVPSSGDWPPDTGIDKGIYKEIELLKLEREPIGSVKAFYRPSLAVPIPTGWHALDGSVILAANHDFSGIVIDITLPDLRNAIILGADATFSLGQAAVAVGSGNIDSSAGAPGGNATGGSNKLTQTIAQMPLHDHGGATEAEGFDNQQTKVFDGDGQAVNVLLGSVISHEQGNHSHPIDAQGGGLPMDIRQRWVGLVYIVKLKYATTI